jgi:hypothetical protein
MRNEDETRDENERFSPEDVACAMKPIVIIKTNCTIFKVRFCYCSHGILQSDA